MDERRSRQTTTVVLIIALIMPAFYVGGYYALVQVYDAVGQDSSAGIDNPTSIVMVDTPTPRYWLIGNKGKAFFAPVHYLDRILRTETWSPRKTRVYLDNGTDQVEPLNDLPSE